MNSLQYIRNIGRIPRLVFHIKRCKGQDERVAGFKEELERRKKEMKIAGHDGVLKGLLGIKLTAQADKDSKKLSVVFMTPATTEISSNIAEGERAQAEALLEKALKTGTEEEIIAAEEAFIIADEVSVAKAKAATGAVKAAEAYAA